MCRVHIDNLFSEEHKDIVLTLALNAVAAPNPEQPVLTLIATYFDVLSSQVRATVD